eukprot:Seg523.10 transcript_id=Seg523.10/GoldUCD/mRNA.D3Y31 product="Protein AMN1-like" protein_id=Seg523.10/GoldUCD/D3Y31
MASRVPSGLRIIALRKVVESIDMHVENISWQPHELKDNILYLLSKRGRITDDNIGKILHRDVIELDLSESEVTDRGLGDIYLCKELRKLDLNAGKGNRMQVTAEGIGKIVEHCKLLQIVLLRRCELIEDTAVSLLATSCPNLTQLCLDGCKGVTDEATECLGKYSSKLKYLDISRTQVTDKGLSYLADGCCSDVLFELHVGYCKDVSDNGIDMLLNYCPNLQILMFDGCPLVTDRSRENIGLLGRRMKQLSWTVTFH